MHFPDFFRFRSILGMPTFHEPCSSFYQSEEPNTELFLRVIPLYITLLVE